jgi:dipeptidyl aminopeptidase/acylaminoacyl peptidase
MPEKSASIRWRRVVGLTLASLLVVLLALDVNLAWLYIDALLYPGCPSPEPLAEHPPHESVFLRSADDLEIEAWYYPGTKGSAILALGGIHGAWGSQLPPVDFLLDAGYPVLQIGTRACTSAPVTLGGKELLDAEAGLQYLLEQPEVDRIALYGFSMGGVTGIRTAARHPEVAAVIAEGGYFNLGQDFTEPGSERGPLRFVFLYTLAGMYWLRSRVNPWQVSPLDDIRRISPRPILLIYGEHEAASGRAELQYEAAGDPKELWLVPGGDHGSNHQVAGEAYQQRVLDFLSQSLGE